MIKILLNIQDFATKLFLSVGTLIKVLLLSKIVKRLPDNKGKELVILGNGPSLTSFLKKSKKFLDGKKTLAVNHFANTELYTQIRPDFYVINAPEFWNKGVMKEVEERRDKLINDLIEKTDWDMILILGEGAKKSKEWKSIEQNNKKIKVFYINTTPVEGGKKFRHICYKYYLGIPRPHNILIPSLISAVNMKFKSVYIAGADHNWLKHLYVADDNTAYLTQKHFYDAQTAKPATMSKAGRNEQRKLYEILIKFVLTFKGYFDVEAYAKENNVNIYNITEGSFIDAFERLKV